MMYCGIDWAEHHHDVAVVDAEGVTRAAFRISDDVSGFSTLCTKLSELAPEMPLVPVALETDRGLLVAALVAAGYPVFAINPKSVDRYRDRYSVSRSKSDAGDALVLAHLLRTDGPRHRQIPADSDAASVISVLARAHQDAIRTRVKEVARLRALLREFFPAALTAFPVLTTNTAVAILELAPTPTAAAKLCEADIWAVARSTGRWGMPHKDAARLHRILTAPQLHQSGAVETATGSAVRAIVVTVAACNTAVADLETELSHEFEDHPHSAIIRSLPGTGSVLGARLLGEFGDDPTRFTDPSSRRSYAGTAPVTRASGKARVVIHRRARNERLSDACRWWAFNAIGHSPGANTFYRQRRAAGEGHEAALRRLANKLVGQLHHCLEHHELYREEIAWPVDRRVAA